MISEEAEHNLQVLISTERLQFLTTGLYPLRPTQKYWFYSLRCILVFIFSSLLFVSMIISLIIGVENLSEMADILYYLITQSAYLWKLSNFVIGRNKILEIEDHLTDPIVYKYLKQYGWKYLENIMKYGYLIAKIFRFLVVLVILFYGVFPLVDTNSNKKLPFAGWYPIDKDKYRISLYVTQLWCVTISAFTNSNLDVTAVLFISIGIAEMKMFKKCLRNINYNIGTHGGISVNKLGEMLQLHEHLIKYIALIENKFSKGIFIQFLASIGVICMTGFQMLIVPVMSAQFALLASYVSCMICQVAMYCWYGNEILFESEGIAESCYMSNWYEGNIKQQKVLFMIMERSKKQIKLTAGKFFTLSLATLVMIFKSSYSYFAVLQRIYKDE